MRKPATAALAACLTIAMAQPAGAAAAERRGPGNASYDIAMRWHADSAVLDGVERVEFENTRASKVGAVWLRLWPNGLGSCAHPRSTVKLLAGGTAESQAAGCTAQKVHLSGELAPGERGAIRLRFSVRVPPSGGRFGYLRGGPALLGNALPILAVTDASGTHREPYTDFGEAGYSLVSSWRVTLDLRRGLKAATTGVQTGSTDVSSKTRRLRFEAAHARDFELAIGSFHRQSTTAGGVRIRLFDTLRSGSDANGLRKEVLGLARKRVLDYVRRFGTYGAPELDIVRTDSVGGGMEYPELVFVDMPDSTASSRWRSTAGLIAHEIAHQWFYGLVGDNQWREPWLDEGFATFASGFPFHTCSPGDPLAGYPSNVRLTSTMELFDARPWLYDAAYVGGACALADLRTGLGTTPFKDWIGAWVADHRYGVATTSDFVAAVRAAAPPGFDVDAYLRASRIDVR